MKSLDIEVEEIRIRVTQLNKVHAKYKIVDNNIQITRQSGEIRNIRIVCEIAVDFIGCPTNLAFLTRLYTNSAVDSLLSLLIFFLIV